MTGPELHYEINVSSAMAAEAVGWTGVGRLDDDTFKIVAGFGRVSAAGASYARFVGEGGKLLGNSADAARGILDPVAISIYGKDVDGIEVVSIQSPLHDVSQRGLFSSFHPNDQPPEMTGVWSFGEQAILAVLKQQLKIHDLPDQIYDAVYYGLAIRSAEPLADSTMRQETEKVLAAARGVDAGLDSMVEEDKAMRRSLTVFGSVVPSDIPMTFRDSRERVGAIERGLLSKLAGYAHNWWSPLEAVREGTDMDLAEPDPQKAYGRELTALEQEDADTVDSQLRTELEALARRREHADRVIRALSRLHRKELSIIRARS